MTIRYQPQALDALAASIFLQALRDTRSVYVTPGDRASAWAFFSRRDPRELSGRDHRLYRSRRIPRMGAGWLSPKLEGI